MKHVFVTSKDCTCDGSASCMICDGGLAICKVCGGMEGSLTTDCPGEMIPMERHNEVYAGKFDYREGKGWVQEKNPTNQTWDYGEAYSRIRASKTTIGSCYGTLQRDKLCDICANRNECKADSETIKNYEARRGENV